MAWFFRVVGGVDDETEIIDQIAKRYGWTIDEINEVDVALLARICEKINERQNREQALAQWTALQPFMVAGWVKELSWTDFWARVENSKVDTRPTSEILADIEEARKELAEDGSI